MTCLSFFDHQGNSDTEELDAGLHEAFMDGVATWCCAMAAGVLFGERDTKLRTNGSLGTDGMQRALRCVSEI